MQAQKKTMTQDEINTFLKSQQVGLLSMTNTESAYAIPVGYTFDGQDISLSMRNQGRKLEYIKACPNVCFVVYWLPQNFDVTAGTSYKSVICDGVLEQVTDSEGITNAIRNGEKQLGLPEGTWDNLLEMTLKDTTKSGFWKIKVSRISGQAVDGFKEGTS